MNDIIVDHARDTSESPVTYPTETDECGKGAEVADV
jgi:hypothetical protein